MDDAHRLAKAIVDRDESSECLFCSKTEWGEEKHDTHCPYAIAYEILKKKDGSNG